MNKRARRSRIGVAFAGIGAGLLALITPNAQATGGHNHADDCKIVAKADRTLCAQVQRQHAYGWTYGPHGESVALNPPGTVDVHDATHQGLTRAEIHDYLTGYRAQYREHVTHVRVNANALRPGCRWVVDVIRVDGVKVTRKRTAC